jgi:hypothetical protein
MYSNTGLGYTEIETLSVEKALKPGETLSNRLYLSCYRLHGELDACELAERTRILIGEKEDPPEKPAP